MTPQSILHTLDHSNDGYYCSFVELGKVYSYLIDTRLNAFRGNNERWAIAVERLGYISRVGTLELDINYYGNCLINLDYFYDRPKSFYSINIIDFDNFNETIDGESLKSDAKFWLVRGQLVSLSHNIQDYANAGIKLEENEPDEIRAEEVGRLVVFQNRDLFRATENELYKSIPTDLDKILVLDEWYHKDFQLQISPLLSDDHLRHTYEFNKSLTGLGGMSFESFAESFRHQEILSNATNRKIWENNRPSAYETWQLIAKVIATNDPNHYKPTLQPNTHWSHWPNSGSM